MPEHLNPLNHPICFSQPHRIADHSWLTHVPFGMFILDLLRPAVLVELGTFNGTSYCAFCQAIVQLSFQARCYAVDTWQGDDHTGHYSPQILDALRDYHDPLYGEFSRLVQSTFDGALPSFPDNSVDLLHIDGFHTYEAVKHDFETWLPKLSTRGIIMLHDINVRERGFGVWRLWIELQEKYPNFEFNHGHGLGIVRVGKEATPALEPLFSLTADRAKGLREFFFKLGSNIETIALKEKEIKILTDSQLALRDTHLAEKERRLQDLTEQLTSQKKQSQMISAQLELSNLELEQLQLAAPYRVLVIYRRILNRVFRPGTRVRQGYDLLAKSLKTLIFEGPRAFLQRFKGWRISRINAKTGVPQVLDQALTNENERDEADARYAKLYQEAFNFSTNQPSPEFVPITEKNYSADKARIKAIAFYLPQFHPIPENNEWWGRGFTEWTNVSKAVPQFVGHYQPHLPGELGFYDLRVPEVMRRQVELAKKYGLYGFCFYYYWFNGKKLLERPLERYISDKKIDFPFCICWANENWTRRWDGRDQEILIAQKHSVESDLAFIEDVAPMLQDSRYVRIQEKPVLILYRANLLPNASETVLRWREYTKKLGIGDIYLIAAQSFGFTDPTEVGFDAAVEFPPHGLGLLMMEHLHKQLEFVNPVFNGRVFDYRLALGSAMRQETTPYTLFRTAMTGWDNTPRTGGMRGYVGHRATPELYQAWLEYCCSYAAKNNRPHEQLVFINAWNEWAEGAHLEPDKKFGYAYLQATADALMANGDQKLAKG